MPKPFLVVLSLAAVLAGVDGRAATPSQSPGAARRMDRDLMEATVPKLHALYAAHRYTVTDVVRWHLARIHRYNGVYRPVETLFEKEALVEASRADAAVAAGTPPHGPLWGIPVVIKANTSIKGTVTTDGWLGYSTRGHELIASRDATVVAKLRAAGAILIGHTNMPDFANSDTNRSSSFGRTGNAYDVRFSPGGSSGGTVTAITANMAVLGTGTDTGNSIRMPAATSAVVGIFPTRGLVSTAGIAPLDWLLDNTGPIARTVTDAAIGLAVMAGPDPLDSRTAEAARRVEPDGYLHYLSADSLKGKRFGVPAFLLHGVGIPFHGVPAAVPDAVAAERAADIETAIPLEPATRAAFMRAIGELEAAGATVVFDESIMPEAFARTATRVATYAYVREGTDNFLREFGPSPFRSIEEYAKAAPSAPSAGSVSGDEESSVVFGDFRIQQKILEKDPEAETNYYGPRRRTLEAYLEPLARLHLDGYVYPAIQMPPVDETMPQYGKLSGGPHSATDWVNMIGVPAIVVVGPFYPSGLPFGLEFSGRPWDDGALLGYAYAYEAATHHRHPPVLVERGLLPTAK